MTVHPKPWDKVLLGFEGLSSLIVLACLIIIANVRGDSFLPTPSCPQGINSTLIPVNIMAKCYDERIKLYEPTWTLPVLWTSSGGVVGCICVGALFMLQTRRLKGPFQKAYWGLFLKLLSLSLIVAVLGFFITYFAAIVALLPGPAPLH